MDDLHKDLCERLFNSVSMFLKDYGFVNPAYFIVKDTILNVLILPQEFKKIEDSDYRKRVEFASALKMCKQIEGDALIHISEAWVVDSKDANIDNYKGKPSEHPARKEAVNLIYVHSNGEQKLLIGDIVKVSDTNQRTLQEPEWVDITELPLLLDEEKPKDVLLQ